MKKEIEVAAEWWTNILREGAKHDNGDGMCNALAALASETTEKDPETVLDKFKRILMGKMEEEYKDKWDSGCYRMPISCDYSPALILHESAVEAGITGSLSLKFPFKTMMWVNPGKVEVSYGYGAPIEVLYEDR